MRRSAHLSIALALITALAPKAHAMHGDRVIQISAKADDGVTIAGEVDLPAGAATSAVLLVPGTGGFDRDAWFGTGATPDDRIFARLATALNAAGLAVIRYDERGRTCRDGEARDPHGRCADAALVETVSPANKASDLVAVAKAARAVPALASTCLTVFAHSEGMMTLARAYEAETIAPDAIIGMGAPMESPAAAIHWQVVDRSVQSLEKMDADGDRVVTRAEIAAAWRAQGLPQAAIDANAAQLKPASTFAEIEARRSALADQYAEARADALAHSDGAPYAMAGVPVASYGWWKMFFTDWRPVASRLAGFAGPVTLFYGDIDAQVAADRQIPLAHDYLVHAGLHTAILPGLGHTLGRNPILGPIDAAGLKAIVGAAKADAGACRVPDAAGGRGRTS